MIEGNLKLLDYFKKREKRNIQFISKLFPVIEMDIKYLQFLFFFKKY